MRQVTAGLALVSFWGISSAIPIEKRAGEGFVNKGLVAFGFIPSSAKDATGDTIGGIGSAIAIKRGSFTSKDGIFTGTIVAQPDRGYNVEGTIDWQPRQHEINFTLTPYYGTVPLTFENAQNTLKLEYNGKTLLYTERGHKKITGLDALGVRLADTVDPSLPIPANSTIDRLALDPEGLVLNRDGSFWISDEYGAYIYKFDSSGALLQVIQPPQSVLPLTKGALQFTSETNPGTGRAPNQGFEGLTASPGGETIYAALQSATIQDGGPDKATNRYTRLLAWNVTTSSPTLSGEWVVPLPQNSKGKSLPQSEIHYLNDKQFLVLSRDGKGRGDDEHDTTSAYKGVDLVDISNATNIHGTVYDGLTGVSPGGKLVSSIKPATYIPFVNLLDKTQLAKFGLHNGGTSDKTLINAKWEGLAVLPALDSAYPNDYFLFVASDNDFITLNGVASGLPYSSSYGEEIDSQMLVYRVTIPTLAKGSVEKAIGL